MFQKLYLRVQELRSKLEGTMAAEDFARIKN